MQAHKAFVRESRLREILLEAPYYRQIIEKPRGYSGDAEMMRIIYRDRPEGRTPFGRFVHKVATSVEACRAVRNRRELLRDEILEHEGDVLSLAAGPAQEILDVLAEGSSARRYLALDHDPMTLRDLEKAFDGSQARAGRANAIAMMKGYMHVDWPRRTLASRLGDRKFSAETDPSLAQL